MGDEYFHREFPPFIVDMNLNINQLELLTITVAVKLWAGALSCKKINFYCDNMTSVMVLQSGRTRDIFLQACVREILFIASKFNFELCAVHLPGADNRLPDYLSRWHLHGKFKNLFLRETSKRNMVERFPADDCYSFVHDW